jgi:hypothetical protein
MSDLVSVPKATLQQALESLENSRSLEPVDIDWVKGKRQATIRALRAALEQPEPDIYALPTNKKEPRPGLVNLEELPGFLYESPNGWHIGDMKVVKWLLNNREADYWEQFKEKP